jgi:ABC-type Mn2+/Zn2+ transport system permease subunit
MNWVETLKTPFVQEALRMGLALAIVGGYIGVFVVLKRIVFVGAALTQVSGAGIALAFLVGWSPLWSAILFALLGSAFFAQPFAERKVSRESILGAFFLTFSALMVLLAYKGPHGMEEIQHLMATDILTVNHQEVVQVWWLGGAILACFLLFRKEFLLIAFDRETAQAMGYRTRLWEFVFYLLLGSLIGFVLHLVGMLLIFGYLVLPAMGALLMTRRLWAAFFVAVLTAVIATVGGILISVAFDLPTTAAIVVLMSVLTWMEAIIGGLRK